MNRIFTPELDARTLRRLEAYAAHFAEDFNRPRQRAWCGVYLAGLLQDGERKSIEPLSRRVSLPAALAGTQDPDQGLQQFVSQSTWDEQAVGRSLSGAAGADLRRPGGRVRARRHHLPEGGHAIRWACSAHTAVPWARRPTARRRSRLHYIGKAGHVPLGDAPVLARELAGRPRAAWTKRACLRVSAEDAFQGRDRPGTARRRARRRTCCPARIVVGDSGYGVSGPLRAGLAHGRGLHYVLGVTGEMVVFTREPRWQAPGPSGGGRPRLRHRSGPGQRHRPEPARGGRAARRFAKSPGARAARGADEPPAFAWLRVWPAHGWATGDCAHAEPIWLLIEEEAGGTIKDAFSNLPADNLPAPGSAPVAPTLEDRTGLPANEGGAGPGPLRGPKLARLPPPGRAGDACLRLFGPRTAPRQGPAAAEKKLGGLAAA